MSLLLAAADAVEVLLPAEGEALDVPLRLQMPAVEAEARVLVVAVLTLQLPAEAVQVLRIAAEAVRLRLEMRRRAVEALTPSRQLAAFAMELLLRLRQLQAVEVLLKEMLPQQLTASVVYQSPGGCLTKWIPPAATLLEAVTPRRLAVAAVEETLRLSWLQAVGM